MKKRSLNANQITRKNILANLKDKVIKSVYNTFQNNLKINDHFAVAVSGGPDSLALAFLSKCYSLKKNLKSYFFIVDHKIRKESSFEAKSVKKKLEKFGIKCKILTWKGKKLKGNIQSNARKIRYNLLFKECKTKSIKSLLIGHHKDDLIENFLIRLYRGSGLRGLTSFKVNNQLTNEILIYRPLIKTRKKALLYLSKKAFNFYINDPFNKDDKFQRSRIRKFLEFSKQEGFNQNKIEKTIDNLEDANASVENYVFRNLSENSFYSKSENKYLLSAFFFIAPNEVIMRSLFHCIKLVGKKYYNVRGKKINKLINEIKKDKLPKKTTLGGCIIKKVAETVIIYAEK